MNQPQQDAPIGTGPARCGPAPTASGPLALTAQHIEAHARALVDSYGIKIAREIVHTNAALDPGNDYWRQLFRAFATGGCCHELQCRLQRAHDA